MSSPVGDKESDKEIGENEVERETSLLDLQQTNEDLENIMQETDELLAEIQDEMNEEIEEALQQEEDLLEKYEKAMKDDVVESNISESPGEYSSHSIEGDNEMDEQELVTEEWVSGVVTNLNTSLSNEEDLYFSQEGLSDIDKALLAEVAYQAEEEMILREDNPLMKKFQQVLKNHLLRQVDHLKKTIFELEGEYKQKEAEYKEDNENVYKMELTVQRQRENLEKYSEKIEEVTSLRTRIEKDMKDHSPEYDELKNQVQQKTAQLEECQNEAEMLGDLLRKLEECDKEQEREIAISKMKQDINAKEKEKLAKEKLEADMLLWKLQKQILAKRRECEARLEKCKNIGYDCEVMSNKLLQATVERAGLLLENQNISKELEKSFLRLKQSDSSLLKTKSELEEAKTNSKKLSMSMRWYRRHTRDLMEEHSELLEERRVSKENFEYYEEKVRKLSDRKSRALEELNAYDELMKAAENDLKDVSQYGNSLRADEEAILKKISRASSEKANLEKQYLEKLLSMERTDKMMKNMNDTISKMVDEHKKQELKMFNIENNVAKLMVELEKMKASLRDNLFELETSKRAVSETEEALKVPEERLKHMKKKEIAIRNLIVEKKNELGTLETQWKNKTYLETPLLAKKRNMLQNIKHLQKSIEEKEMIWMQMQEGCLKATKKRNEQLEKINCLKKQISVIETSLSRSAEKIKKEQVEFREIMSELKAVGYRMERLHEAELKQGQAKQKVEESNKDREDEFVELLKDMEVGITRIQQEIWDLEESSQEMTKSIETLQKELLEWDKKYKLAVEMKKEIETEKSKGGEIADMKSEIHRMEVRYSNLRKAEERMISDLELCLGRRDSIVDSAEAREKRAKACGITSRIFTWRKLEEMKTKLRSLIRAVKELKAEKENCLAKRKELSEELEFWKSSVERLSQSLQQLEQQIHEGQIHRHRTLEMTVMRQRKAKLLEELRYGRYRVMSTEDKLAVEQENVFAIRNALVHILDELKNDFPTLNLQLTQIENTISYNIDPDGNFDK